jgi:hypothetical protein
MKSKLMNEAIRLTTDINTHRIKHEANKLKKRENYRNRVMEIKARKKINGVKTETSIIQYNLRIRR